MQRSDRNDARRIAVHDSDGRQLVHDALDDAALGELFRRLTSDASLLVRQEISLAKAEMRESLDHLKATVTRLAIAAALAIPAALALTAFLVIALGDAINSYWASALIVGVILFLAAVVLARQGMAGVEKAKEGLQRTAESVGDDARWGKEEIRTFKRELTA
jgi:hypothetical protein